MNLPSPLRLIAPRYGGYAADLPHALAIERTLAAIRILLLAVSLAVGATEPSIENNVVVVALLLALCLHAIVVLVLLRTGRVSSTRHLAIVHALDSAGILGVIFVTGGATSPFSTVFFFVLLAAGYRWGGMEVGLTVAFGILVIGAQGVVGEITGWMPAPDAHILGLRLIYVATAAAMIGWVAEAERRQRYRSLTTGRIMLRLRSEAGLVSAIQVVMDELLAEFSASHAVLTLEEEGEDRVWLWEGSLPVAGGGRVNVEVRHSPRASASTYLFAVPDAVDAWTASRPADDLEPRVAALDLKGSRVEHAFSAAPLLAAPFEWRTVFCASAAGGEGWRARLFLFVPVVALGRLAELRHLQVVVHEVGPAVFTLYLQRRLRSRAGVVERARVARELQEGIIQSLIGAEMQLEVLRREAAAVMPETTSARLQAAQSVLGRGILDVRDLMRLLRPEEVEPKRLVEHLAGIVERFRLLSGIQARFSCDTEELDLPPRVCRELAAIVDEALANVRKHSGATSVLVRLGSSDGQWQLIIDDNGRGLDFEGYLPPEEVDRLRKGPLIIKERVRAVGGRLALHSQPGFGARLEITIPRKHHG